MRVNKISIAPIAVPDVPLANPRGLCPAGFLRSAISVAAAGGLVRRARDLDTHSAWKTTKGAHADPPLPDAALLASARGAFAGLHVAHQPVTVAAHGKADEMSRFIPDFEREVHRW